MSEYQYLGVLAKELRKKKNMTLKQLSEETGLSIGYLSQFERGLATAAIDSLDKIARVLGTTIGAFFKDQPAAPKRETLKYDMMKSHERVVSNIDNTYVQYNLINNPRGSVFLPRFYEVLPEQMCTARDNVFYQHEGYEFLYVLEGILTVVVDDTTMHLHEGDCIMIHSPQKHTWINETYRTTKILAIHTPNPYLEEMKIHQVEQRPPKRISPTAE